MKCALFISFTLAAAQNSLVELSNDELALLQADLDLWQTTFGEYAAENGLMPKLEKEKSDQAILNDKLARLLDTKAQVKRAGTSNPRATFTWKNPFALMSVDEFKVYVSKSFDQKNLRNIEHVAIEQTYATPTSVDWTTKCNNEVRDQGPCTSGWAHAAVSVAESAHCFVRGELPKLSIQQTTSCSTNGGNQGCSGGSPWLALDYLRQEGLCTDQDWPYNSQTGTCQNGCVKKPLALGATVRSGGEGNLFNALSNQPVVVTVEAGNEVWKNYRSGVVTACPGGPSDHAVVAVGYECVSFKLKNSWSRFWGENGYIRVQMGGNPTTGVCNVFQDFTFPQLAIGGATCGAFEYDIDYIGQDIRSRPTATAADCCQACTDEKLCNAYTWAQNVCYMKRVRGETTWKSSLISGRVNKCSPLENGVDYIGNDISNVPSASVDDCCAHCRNVDGCRAFSYAYGVCYLKSGKGTTASNSNVKSALVL